MMTTQSGASAIMDFGSGGLPSDEETIGLPLVADASDPVGRLSRHVEGLFDVLLGGVHDRLAPWALIGLVALVVGVVVGRAVLVWRALRSRAVWATLPADEFDPEPEDVARFAFQLVRVRRAGRARLERPASAVRIRLDSVPEGRLLYSVEAPKHARSVLRAAAFDRVELRDRATLELPDAEARAEKDVGDPAPGDESSSGRDRRQQGER